MCALWVRFSYVAWAELHADGLMVYKCVWVWPPVCSYLPSNTHTTVSHLLVSCCKWTVLIEHFSSLSDHSKHFYTTCHIHLFTHIHTLMTEATTQCTNLLIRREINHSHTAAIGSNLGLSILPKEDIMMWTGGLGLGMCVGPVAGLQLHETAWSISGGKQLFSRVPRKYNWHWLASDQQQLSSPWPDSFWFCHTQGRHTSYLPLSKFL